MICVLAFMLFFRLGEAQNLKQLSKQKVDDLYDLIEKAEQKGIDVSRERVTYDMGRVFLGYADWDEDNKSVVSKIFKTRVEHAEIGRTADDYAALLPDFERREVIAMVEEATASLNKLISNKHSREKAINVRWDKAAIEGRNVMQDGKPVFLTSFNSIPNKSFGVSISDTYGRVGSSYYHPNGLHQNASGEYFLSAGTISRIKKEADNPTLGVPFLGKGTLSSPFKEQMTLNGAYDIDHPLARVMHKEFFGRAVPLIAGKRQTKLGYLMANEPHWNISRSYKLKEIGVPTKKKFAKWLEEQHGSITKLNKRWKSAHSSFQKAANTFITPINKNLIGDPKWYDYIRFNQVRVKDHFKSIDTEIKKNDPEARTFIKIIPTHLTVYDRAGLDIEYLTELTDIIGHDGHMEHNTTRGRQPWQDLYKLNWAPYSMQMDFFHSVNPTGINYNSENHTLNANNNRDLFMKRSTARAQHWMSAVLGVDVNVYWVWPRADDGSYATAFDKAATAAQQPGVVNAIYTTNVDLNTFSEEIAQIQEMEMPLRLFFSETSIINNSGFFGDMQKLYSSLFFEGHRLGWATEDIIKKQDNSDWSFIIVTHADRVRDSEFDALQDYLNGGGTILLDGTSLKENQYGEPRTESLVPGSGKIIRVPATVEQLSGIALNLLAKRGYSNVISVVEHNMTSDLKSVMHRSVRTKEGKNVVSLVNLGVTAVKVNLGLNSNSTVSIKNLFTGESLKNGFSIAPEEVLLLEVSPKSGSLIKDGPVSVYDNCDFGGRKAFFDEGIYDLNALRSRFGNDRLSSLKVKKGYRATLYESNLEGRTVVFSGDDACLSNDSFNDRASALKVERIVSNSSDCNFEKINGLALDIGSGGGKTYVIGLEQKVYERNSEDTGWERLPLGGFDAKRIDVTGSGVPWVISDKNEIYFFEYGKWTKTRGYAKDISANGNLICIVGTDGVVYKWNDIDGWIKLNDDRKAKRVDVSINGQVWIISTDDFVYQLRSDKWLKVGSFKAKDISFAEGFVGLWGLSKSDGKVFLYKSPNKWVEQSGTASAISVGSYMDTWMVSDSNAIYRGSCPAKVSVQTTASDPVSRKSQEKEKEILLYPNPTEGVLKVNLSDYTGVDVKYVIRSLEGRTVAEGDFTAQHAMEERIDLSTFRGGLYLIRLMPSDGVVQTKQVLVKE